MLFSTLTLTVLGAAASPALDHGKLPWFEGTWDQLLAKAQAEKKLVFVDFWTEW